MGVIGNQQLELGGKTVSSWGHSTLVKEADGQWRQRVVATVGVSEPLAEVIGPSNNGGQ